ncbi:aminopeptidase N-like [Camponotus floridanus]|uniref:aminopeptidase N-like n=1 Tax=Camponotus floridanus TaxID=104421 RepID=UPI000DC67B94|nr:aminopeptidase N-like [Camponotus floridanus]
MNIYVLNRAQIIDDAFHLMITNQLNSIVFWNITKYLSRETDYVAWYPMFKALEYLSNIFLFQENIYVNIKDNMLYLLNNLLNKLKYDEVSSEYDLTKSLRMEAARWACNLDSETCIKNAQLNLNRHLKDPGNNTLLLWWKEWTYCQGLKILQVSAHATFIVIINHVYSINQLKKINKLAESYKRMVMYLPMCSNIYQYVLNIQSKIRRRNFEIKCQKDYFQNFMKYQ